MTEMLLLALIVFFSYGIEAALGFGCTILAVTMAVHLYNLEVLLPVLVSLNLVLSAYIVLRHRDAVCWRVLLGRILPLMIVGMPAGMLLLSWGDGPYLKLGFGVFVVLLSAVELWRSRARASGEPPLLCRTLPSRRIDPFGRGRPPAAQSPSASPTAARSRATTSAGARSR